MIEFFNKLSSKEINQFEKFVSSPYHNTNLNVSKLFRYLKSRYPQISGKDLNKKRIFRYVYRVGKYNDTLCRKLISDFTKVYENFLIQIEFETHRVRNRISLLKSLSERDFLKYYKKHINKLGKIISAITGTHDEYYYLNLMNFDSEVFNYQFSKTTIREEALLKKLHCDIDNLYFYLKLGVFQLEATGQAESNKKMHLFKNQNFRYVLKTVEKNISYFKKNHPRIYIRYVGLKAFECWSNDKLQRIYRYLNELEIFFRKEFDTIEFEILKSCFSFIEFSYNCLRIKEPLNLNHSRKLLNFYDFVLVKKSTSYSVAAGTYVKALNAAFQLKKYTWADNFIKIYKNKIFPKYVSRNLHNFGRTKYFFELKDYKQSISYLNRVSYEYDDFYFYSSKFLYLQIYYETDNYFCLKNELNSLKHYLKKGREIITELRINTYLKYFTKLVELKKMKSLNKKTKADIKKSELQKEKNPGANIDWFYEKFSEIE